MQSTNMMKPILLFVATLVCSPAVSEEPSVQLLPSGAAVFHTPICARLFLHKGAGGAARVDEHNRLIAEYVAAPAFLHADENGGCPAGTAVFDEVHAHAMYHN